MSRSWIVDAASTYMLLHILSSDVVAQVDMGSIFESLRVCSGLTDLTLKHNAGYSQQSCDAVPLSLPPVFLAPVLNTLQVLEVTLSHDFLDLEACSQLHTLKIPDAFASYETSGSSPPLACIITGLRALSKKFKMPERGQWARPNLHLQIHPIVQMPTGTGRARLSGAPPARMDKRSS
jgi:hypothetical protein